jgi:glycosyltransferase involved in cell wall biosynthesis
VIVRKLQISVVTPTFYRPAECLELLENLSQQRLLPVEVILVDGAPPAETGTEKAVADVSANYPFEVRYLRKTGGTAIQRNYGIDAAQGDFVALIDDDVRLDKDFFRVIINSFAKDNSKKIGGIVGFRRDRYFTLESATRWKWYKKLGLLKVFEPGRYDYDCGYPINNYLQPPFTGTRRVDFMTTACAVWRREVFADGLRFHPFFQDYGVLEDAHFSLRAGRNWQLLQSGDATCRELSSPNGRVDRRRIGYKCVVNYYFVFQDIVRPLSAARKFRFWRYQIFELFRIASSGLRRRRRDDWQEFMGRIEGFWAVFKGAARA